jgi:hypothetical protein
MAVSPRVRIGRNGHAPTRRLYSHAGAGAVADGGEVFDGGEDLGKGLALAADLLEREGGGADLREAVAAAGAFELMGQAGDQLAVAHRGGVL